eukprot:148254-Rhodomonas_salina.1
MTANSPFWRTPQAARTRAPCTRVPYPCTWRTRYPGYAGSAGYPRYPGRAISPLIETTRDRASYLDRSEVSIALLAKLANGFATAAE